MDAQTALLMVLRAGHSALEGVIEDCSSETLHVVSEGATIGSIASIYAHAVFAEDFFIQQRMQSRPWLHESEGWAAKTGIPTPQYARMDLAWAAGVKMDLSTFREYARAVHGATEAFIGGLGNDIERRVQSPAFGEQTVGWYLSTIIAPHTVTHAGEIAALKGIRGLKGLPF